MLVLIEEVPILTNIDVHNILFMPYYFVQFGNGIFSLNALLQDTSGALCQYQNDNIYRGVHYIMWEKNIMAIFHGKGTGL
jgi:hypothetical protein